MRAECIQAIAQAMGRSITQKEAEKIEQRISDAMRRSARQDPEGWRSMSREERLNAGAELAAADLLGEAAKAKQRVALTVLAHDRLMNRYSTLVAEGMKPFAAVAKVLDSVSTYSKGVSNEYFSRLIDTIEAVDARFLGMVENGRQAADLVREIFGEATGNAVAKKAAKAWLDTVESMRQRFNRAGGDIGKLDYGYLPQPHDAVRVLKAGQDKWVGDLLPLLDRSRYIDENGAQLNDAQLAEVMAGAWETITSGGLNKAEPGARTGTGMRANRGMDTRAIHFKDAGAYLQYAAAYNKGGVMSAMQGHVSRLAKDIALVEEMGPNPETQFKFMHDTATKTGGSDVVGPWLVRTKDMWNVLNGTVGNPVNVRLAEVAQGARNVEVFGKLGSALLSSVTDIPTYFVATSFNKLGYWESTKKLLSAFGSESRDYANRAGLVADSIVSDMNRWAEGNIGKGWTGKLANATMKASLLEAWTDAIRRGFSVTMMGALGKLSRGDWKALEASDRARLERQGVTEADFKVWQLAEPESWRNSLMLTAPSLRAIPEAKLTAAGLTQRDLDRAASRLLGVIADESEYASLGQDLQTRAAVTRSTQKGTVEGEFLRSVALFKGFPMAMISRHWGRMADMLRDGDKASSVWYGAKLITMLTVFGGLATQLKDMANGKDPRDMSDPKFWGAAFVQGGGMGVFGDILYTGLGGQNRAGVPNWLSLLGPVFGSVVEGANVTIGNIGEAARGKETHAGAETLRFAKSHLPFINLWYAKAAIDHAVLQDAQEFLSPGYLSRMQDTARKDWNQAYYWRPGEERPDRLPDISKAFGG